jgi:hypothetical protein
MRQSMIWICAVLISATVGTAGSDEPASTEVSGVAEKRPERRLVVHAREIVRDERGWSLSAPWIAAGHEADLFIRSEHPVTIEEEPEGAWTLRGAEIEIHYTAHETPVVLTVDQGRLSLNALVPDFIDREAFGERAQYPPRARLEESDPRKVAEYMYAEARAGNLLPMAASLMNSNTLRGKFGRDKAGFLREMGIDAPDPDRWELDTAILEHLRISYPELLTVTHIEIEREPADGEDEVVVIAHRIDGRSGMHFHRVNGKWIPE